MRSRCKTLFNVPFFGLSAMALSVLGTWLWSYNQVLGGALVAGAGFYFFLFVIATIDVGMMLTGRSLFKPGELTDFRGIDGRLIRAVAVVLPIPFIFVAAVSAMDVYSAVGFGCPKLESKVMTYAYKVSLGKRGACDQLCKLIDYHLERGDWRRVEQFAKQDLKLIQSQHCCSDSVKSLRIAQIAAGMETRGKVTEAQRLYRKAVKIDSNPFTLQALQSCNERQKGDKDDCRNAYEHAIMHTVSN